jgi:hypothetical protein
VFLKIAAFKVNFAAASFLRPQVIFNALSLSRPKKIARHVIGSATGDTNKKQPRIGRIFTDYLTTNEHELTQIVLPQRAQRALRGKEARGKEVRGI